VCSDCGRIVLRIASDDQINDWHLTRDRTFEFKLDVEQALADHDNATSN
jgi:hypothetical protein